MEIKRIDKTAGRISDSLRALVEDWKEKAMTNDVTSRTAYTDAVESASMRAVAGTLRGCIKQVEAVIARMP